VKLEKERDPTLKKLLPAFFCLFLLLGAALSQTIGVPYGLIRRTFYIKVGNLGGTAFAIQYKAKQYLITAKHVVKGLPTKDAHIEYLRKGVWRPLAVSVITPRNEEVDIAVLVAAEDIANQEDAAFGELTFIGSPVGGQVYFLGFPYGLHSLNGSDIVPFVKRGILSAIDGSDDTAVVLYVDGFSNEGFSGGPVAFFDSQKNTWKIAGVIQGYKPEQAKVRVKGQDVSTNTLVNSGILVAYSIQHALEAIDASTPH
jgi:hypothetical protein